MNGNWLIRRQKSQIKTCWWESREGPISLSCGWLGRLELVTLGTLGHRIYDGKKKDQMKVLVSDHKITFLIVHGYFSLIHEEEWERFSYPRYSVRQILTWRILNTSKVAVVGHTEIIGIKWKLYTELWDPYTILPLLGSQNALSWVISPEKDRKIPLCKAD